MISVAGPTTLVDTKDGPSVMGGIRSFLFPGVSGVLLALSFPPGNFEFLAWIALVPLGLALREKRNSPELYFGLYLGGLAFHLVHLDWIRSGTGSTGFSGPRSTQWLAQGILLALMWPLILSIGRAFIRRVQMPIALGLPIVWVAFEFCRKNLWAIADATGYPYGQLGLTQGVNPRLIQIADLSGVYAVSALVASVNGLAVDVIVSFTVHRKQVNAPNLISAIATTSVAIGLALLYGEWRLSQNNPDSGPVMCLMPFDNAFGDNPNDVCKLHDSIATARSTVGGDHGSSQPEMLIWSEGALLRPLQLVPDSETVASMERLARLTNTALVIGCDRLPEGRAKLPCNAAVVIDPQRGYMGCYDKLRLVPFSEFYPPGRPKFAAGVNDRYLSGHDYPVFEITAGEYASRFSFAVAICYDTAFPDVFRRFMRPGPNRQSPSFFVVPACEAHDRQMRLQDVLLQLARFRAIECRRAFVRNSEGGYSGIIDGNGTLIAAPSEINFDKPVILGRIPMDERFSPYVVLGDWLPIAAWAAIGLVILAPIGRRTTAWLFPRTTNSKAGAEPQARTR